jgi:hypothetical protein
VIRRRGDKKGLVTMRSGEEVMEKNSLSTAWLEMRSEVHLPPPPTRLGKELMRKIFGWHVVRKEVMKSFFLGGGGGSCHVVRKRGSVVV